MSEYFPASVVPEEIEFQDIANVQVSHSHSMRRSARRFGGQLWKLDLVFPELTESELREIYNFYLRKESGLQSFWYRVPSIRRLGSLTGTPSVTARVSDNEVTVGSLPVSQSELLMPGDIVQFTGSTKVYWVTQPLTSDAGGVGHLHFYPNLVEEPSMPAPLVYDDVRVTVAFQETRLSYTAFKGLFARLGVITLQEVLV